MKVLVVGTGGAIVSGISAAADEMARTLPRFGHEVERLHAGKHMRRRANRLNLENVRAVVADAVAVASQARRGRSDVVWVHTHGMPTLPALRAVAMATAARLAGRPAVVELHAFGLENFVAGGGVGLRAALRALSRLAGAVVVVHESAARALAGLGSKVSVHVLHNWVEVPDEVPAPPASPPPLRLVLVGGLVRRKGVPQLLDAMRALADAPVTLTLVGGPGEDGFEALQALQASAADLVASGRVAFAGEKDAAGVRAELRAAHLFVLPSDAEGMPIAMLEALAEGRATLVTGAGGMRAAVEETGCGWVLPDRDPATIAAWVRRILADPPGLAAASAAAREAAVARFSAGTRQAQIDRILASAVAGSRRSTAPGDRSILTG